LLEKDLQVSQFEPISAEKQSSESIGAGSTELTVSF
jgi:hypothetical protein